MTTTDSNPFLSGAFSTGNTGSTAAGAFDTSPPPHNTAAPPPTQDGPPVFGRRRDAAKRIPFTLLTYRDDDAVENLLTARADIDTGSVFALGRSSQSTGAQITAIRNLLMRTLVDDDGIGLRGQVEQVAPDPEGSELVPVDTLPNDAWSMADVEWRTPDGQLHDNPDDAHDHMREHGSSLRRFAAIMDDDSLWVEQTALEEIIDYLMSQAADRPTQRSSAPSRSRRRTGR